MIGEVHAQVPAGIVTRVVAEVTQASAAVTADWLQLVAAQVVPLLFETNVVTLLPGIVYVKDPELTATFACWARFRLPDVIHGVIALALSPLSAKICETDPEFVLIATISNAPVLWFRKAVT